MPPSDAADKRRQQIVTVAKAVFAELGYHNASVSEIIARTGIARGTFYLYFPHKRQVFDAILSLALEQLASRLTRIVVEAGRPSPREQLHASLSKILDFLVEDQPLTRLLLNHGLTPDAEAAERVATFYDQVMALIRSSLDQGIEMGLVRACDTALVSAALFGAVRGVVAHLLRAQDQAAAMVEAASRELIDFALSGVVVAALWDNEPPEDS